MMMRKTLVTLLVVTFVLGIASMASAASLSDIEGEDYEDAASVLNALEVLTGYPDGTFRGEDEITRAEFAAVVVRALGLESAASYAKGSSQFSDVEAGAWYTGYINVAANEGIVNGYPDGTFKPANNVTYAEAVTMLVRALGYEPSLKPGVWPVPYLVKAADLGVTDDVEFDARDNATRGDVAQMTYNSLDVDMMEQVGFGDEVYYEVPEDPTNMLEKLDVEVIEDVVIEDAGVLLDSSLDDDEIKIEDDSTTYTVVVDADLMSLVGLEVDLWVDGDDVLAIDNTNADDIAEISDDITIDDGDLTGGGQITLTDDDDNDTTYTVLSDAVVVHNFEVVTNFTGADVDGEWKMIANADDEISYLWIVDYDLTPGIVDEVDVDDEVIEFKKTADLDLSGEDDYSLFLNGEAITLEDLEEWDLVYEFAGSEATLLLVVRDSIAGDLDRQRDEWSKVYIDGEKYDVSSGAYYSTNAGDDLSSVGTSGDSDLLGEDVEVLLDIAGDAFVIIGDVEEAADNYAVVASSADTDTQGYETVGFVRLFTTDGEDVVYSFEQDYFEDDLYDVNGADHAVWNAIWDDPNDALDPDPVRTLVKYSLNEAGEIDKMEVVTPDFSNVQADLDDTAVADDMEDYERINDSGTYYYVASDTVIFDVTANDYDDWAIVSWSAVVDASTSGDTNADVTFTGTQDKNDIEYMLVTGDLGVAEDDDVLFVDAYQGADGYFIEYYVDGSMESAEVTSSLEGSLDEASEVAALEYKVVTLDFDIDGKVKNITPLQFESFTVGGQTTDTVQLGNDPITGSRLAIEHDGGTTEFLVTSDTVIFDTEDDNVHLLSLSDLGEDDYVMVIQGDPNVADYIVRVDAPSAE